METLILYCIAKVPIHTYLSLDDIGSLEQAVKLGYNQRIIPVYSPEIRKFGRGFPILAKRMWL